MNTCDVLTAYCLDKKCYWNGHFIATLSTDNITPTSAILAMQKRLTNNDKDVLCRIRKVYYG